MGRNFVDRFGIFIWCGFIIGNDKLFQKFMLDNVFWLSVVIGLVFLVAFILWGGMKVHERLVNKRVQANIVLAQTTKELAQAEKAFDSPKKYEPIPGIRYKPHWYLQDALPRNVVPKKAPLQIEDSDTDNEVTKHNGTWVTTAGYGATLTTPSLACSGCGADGVKIKCVCKNQFLEQVPWTYQDPQNSHDIDCGCYTCEDKFRS